MFKEFLSEEHPSYPSDEATECNATVLLKQLLKASIQERHLRFQITKKTYEIIPRNTYRVEF